MKRYFLLYILILQIIVCAQTNDSSLINRDSTVTSADSLTQVQDSTKGKKSQDITAIIYANAVDSLIFKVKTKKMELYGQSELKYKQTGLKSADIKIDFNTNQLYAEGTTDSSDTSAGKIINTPVMTEGSETYEGSRITYNFKNQRGFISLARTKSEGTSYGGEKVKKLDKVTYFVKDGIYSTCTDSIPHYNFYAKEMKVIIKEQIIAKWIWLYFGGVPFPIPLPFAAFPTESGRRSGIIAPAYGQDDTRGWYLSHLGYFWAISDYMDVNGTMDYFFKGGFNLNSRFRYAKRYSLNGTVTAGYSNLHKGETGDPEYTQNKNWNISVAHNQTINPTTRFDANLSFVSGKQYFTDNYYDYNNVLRQNIYSRANFSKTWDESGNSLSLSYQRNQNLETGDINETLPSLAFSMYQFYPFKSKGRTDPADQKWYEQLGFSYSGDFKNERIKKSGNLSVRGGIEHNIGTSVSPKIGYINVSPRISYVEKWYNKQVEKHIVRVPVRDDSTGAVTYKDSLATNDVRKLSSVRTFNFSLSASTRLYGILQPNAFGIEAFRHTITPSISYGYTPDFSEDKWGYYGSYVNSAGRKIKYDKYEREVYGGGGGGESQSISFSVGNVFEIKTMKDPTDTTSEQKKIQLLNLDANLGYNFAADSLRLSNLGLSYRTQVADIFSFNGRSTYSFYDYDGQRQINKFRISEGKGLLKLTEFAFSASATLSAEKFKGKQEKQANEDSLSEEPTVFDKNNDMPGLYQESEPDFEIPWSLSLNYNYGLNKISHSKYSNISLSGDVNLTKTWKLSLSAYYDIFKKELQAPSISIYKDLHCWELSINWQPIGMYRGYRFELRIKASQLQDLKITRRRGQYSGRY
ncbi:MAG: LPS-assembly protein LptD [Ignavibacteriales bacterium]|nr:MAG: LPS-assembly protein LptD [Ignavibacteriales bacterium]